MLKIHRTGLELWGPEGEANLKMLVVGGPGAGKSRMASYWPKPIYLDCEDGLASCADRGVPYARIKGSQDALDALAYLKTENMRPRKDRPYLTVVVDTLDSFARKVQDEWLQRNPQAESFRGFEAWGYLQSKLQMLTTRLLNLDMNVIINCHYKEKTIREGVGDQAVERQELMLQLQGDIKDSIFNDLDLVGFLGTYYGVQDGQRVKKRGITFTETPDRPFLKDRLNIMPTWMEITFSDQDYHGLFVRLKERIEQLKAAGATSEEIGEIPRSTNGFGPAEGTITGIVAPGKTGALPPMEAAEAPLASRSKPELLTIARDLGVDGIRGNTLKSELVTMIEAAGGIEAWRKAKAAPAEPAKAAEPEPETPNEDRQPEPQPEEPDQTFTEEELADAANIPQCMAADGNELCLYDRDHDGGHSWASELRAPAEVIAENAAFAEAAAAQAAAERSAVEASTSDEAAVAAVKEGLGGTVVSRTPTRPAVPAPAAPKGVERPGTCSVCEGDINADPSQELTGGKPISPTAKESYIRVAWIKHRAHMCAGCYLAKVRPSA